MLFDNEKEKQRRLEMAERLFKRIIENSITLSGRLFDSLVFVFTESQQWRQLIDTLAATSLRNCTPDIKTLNYLKKNLLYCFEPTTRGQLKEQIERIEDTFFPPQSATQAATQPGSDSASKAPGKKYEGGRPERKNQPFKGSEERQQSEEGKSGGLRK